MKPIEPPVTPDSPLDAIANLKECLLFLLGREVIRFDPDMRTTLVNDIGERRADRSLRGAERKAIGAFQEQFRERFHLEPTGELDERTGAAMNAVLRDSGAFGEEDRGWAEVVRALGDQQRTLTAIHLDTGHLASIDQKIGGMGRAEPLMPHSRGDSVRQLHEQLASLGVVLPAGEKDEAVFGVATRDALLQLQAKHGIPRTGLVDDATRTVLDTEVSVAAHPNRLEGQIFLENGLPAARIALRIVNKGFGEDEQELGAVETDERGYYALPYQRNGAAINIEVRALDGNGTPVRLSKPKVKVDRHEVLNLVAPSAVKSQANEFKLMSDDLDGVVQGGMAKLAQARETADRQDVSLLHQATGWDARLIATAAAAVQMNGEIGIAHDALYGAFRAGLPTAPEALALVSTEAFETALKRANDAGIAALGAEQIAAAKGAFETFALETRRKAIVPGALSSVGQMLDKARIGDAHKAAFEKLVLMHDGDDAALWAGARAEGIPDGELSSLQLQGKLAFLTLNNAPLTDALQAEITSQDKLDELVDKDLYRKDQWISRLNALAAAGEGGSPDERLAKLIPSAYAQPELGARVDAYAGDLARKVRQSFPTQVTRRMLENDELKLGAQHAEVKAPAQTFLSNAAGKGFLLGRMPVDQFVKQHGESVFEGIADDKKHLAQEGVKLLTRAYQMTPDDESMATLLDLGFSSARQVAGIAKTDFVERYWERFGSRKLTETVYDKSVQITSVTFNVYALGKKIDSTPPVMGISGSPQQHNEAKEKLKSLLKDYPTMESLFGSMDFCECEHCRSVLSPAAYLVDLIRFTDPPEQDWQHAMNYWAITHNGKTYTGPEFNYLKPYDALLLRRPDLPHLPLTCENTNTVLPSIDLVNEVLEYFVANSKLDAGAAHDTGQAGSAELIAEPQNILPKAYDALKSARYPLTLPFDLWLETVRRFCEYFEAPLWQVLDVFRHGDDLFGAAGGAAPYDRAQILSEYLGLAPAEYALYTAPAFADWPRLYGYDTEPEAAARAELKSAKTLSRRLGVSYKELVELVKTGFVNPRLSTLVTLRKLNLEPGDVFRFKKHAAYLPVTQEEKDEALLEDAAFETRLAQATDRFTPEFDAKQWLDDAWDGHQFEKILVLRDAGSGGFDGTTLSYTDVPDADVDALDYLKLNLFVRLWKRLGWSIEETDLAFQAFLPAPDTLTAATLGAALRSMLAALGHFKELTSLVSAGKNSRAKMLALWAPLATKGINPLYAQLFLTRNVLKDDTVFDDALGNYLAKAGVLLKDHMPALQSALTLTADEIAAILQDGNTGDESDAAKSSLSLGNVSMLYRYGLLARALKLTVGELIALKAMSGFDPFTPLKPGPAGNLGEIEKEYPTRQTLEFVRLAQQLKAGAFAIGDVDYLFRHRFDPVGKYSDGSTSTAWLGELAAQLHTIASDYAVPSAEDDVDDDVLRQKMGLVFAPDVVEMFMSFWLNTAAYSAAKRDVVPAKRLVPAIYSLPGVSVAYDEARARQQLTHIGVLTAAAKTALLNQVPVPPPGQPDAADARQLFSDLLDDVVAKSNAQVEAFFAKHFDGLLKFQDFFDAGVPAPAAGKRLSLLQKILPFLRAKLTRQTVLHAVTAQLSADPALVETLLANDDFLSLPDDPAQALLARFEALSRFGVTAVLTPSAAGAVPVREVAGEVKVQPADALKEASWNGFLQVSQAGAYRFYARLGKKDATVSLRFAHMAEAVLEATAARADDEVSGFAELQAGVLYAFTVEAGNLQDGAFELLAKGEISAKNRLNQFVLLPKGQMDAATQSFAMLGKALQLVQGAGLNEREVRHILAHPDNFGGIDLKLLPTQAVADTAATRSNAATLFRGLASVLGYAALKRDLAGGGDGLVAVFEQARLAEPETPEGLCERVAILTRRKPELVQSVAAELGMTASVHFADPARIETLWRALQVVDRFGVSMETLKQWLTPQPDAGVATKVRDAVKSHYEPEAWQRVAKEIYDPLRQRRRDALVAHIMHLQPALDSVEKLFEYFLIDPGTEPVVQTSRLRMAISSLQTFIQRCFLSLEKQVHPSVLNARHWQWMKRYRVWEANRKIFLFPENWLEPEWRDDKTHLYRELEGSLLQGDVTNQLAEDALHVYLKKLDQLARLDIVTMYAEEKALGPPVMHVIGRTFASPHQYFYRRYAQQMWTPWEPVSAEIDGEHIVAVVWRERLHLFWVTFLEKVTESTTGPQSSETKALGALPAGDLVKSAVQTSRNAVYRTLEGQLNWSEHFQGEWTARESSGFIPARVLFEPFDSSKLSVQVSKETDPETGAEGAVWITLDGFKWGYEQYPPPNPGFRVVSKNSRPAFSTFYKARPGMPYSAPGRKFNRYQGTGALSVKFVQQVVTTDGVQKADAAAPVVILSKGGDYTVLPTANQMQLPNAEFAPLISPLFYADDTSTFFLEPSLTETTVDKWQGYTITRPSHKSKWDEYIAKPVPMSPVVPPKYMQEALNVKDVLTPEPVDPLALHAFKPNRDALTQPEIGVQFGDAVIGRAGRLTDLGTISRVVTSLGGGVNL